MCIFGNNNNNHNGAFLNWSLFFYFFISSRNSTLFAWLISLKRKDCRKLTLNISRQYPYFLWCLVNHVRKCRSAYQDNYTSTSRSQRRSSTANMAHSTLTRNILVAQCLAGTACDSLSLSQQAPGVFRRLLRTECLVSVVIFAEVQWISCCFGRNVISAHLL